MSDTPPLRTLPDEVEPRKFAQRGVELKGAVPVARLTRLAQSVAAVKSVTAELNFGVDLQGDKCVHGAISAQLVRECQRCLENMEQNVHCDVDLAIVWDDEQAKGLSQRDPWVVPEEFADLYAMLEEEVLLNMPFLCYHDFQCVPEELLHPDDGEQGPDKETKSNPFELLKQLKDSTKN